MSEDKLERLKQIGRNQTAANTQSREAARTFLLKTGIYKKNGELKKSYGG
ncbi:hypothetical protein [Caulobacter sp. S45]|nr:hypothetical protein [Caulobacter sp. S45]